jgi:hypothetical protein
MTAAALLALAVLAAPPPAAPGAPSGQEVVQVDVGAEVEAAVEKARALIREGSRFEAALNELAPLLAKLFRLTDPKRQLELSSEVFLLKGLAYAGLADDASARREFRNLFELGPDVAKGATKNLFGPRILLLLKQAERESQGLSIDLTLGIITDPPGATVRVDGREAGLSPMIYKTAKAEKIVLEVSLAGYRPVREEVVVDQYEMRRDFVLEFTGLTLVVRSDPPGAKVLLDGQDTGLQTPGSLSQISVGRHQVKLVKETYKEWETWIDSAEGKTEFTVEAKLVGTGYVSAAVVSGTAQSTFRAPTAVAVDRDGNYVVLDASDRKVSVFDNVLKTMTWFDPGLVAEIGLVSPQAVAVDGRNRYFLVDAETHAVFVLNEAGKAPSKWGEFGAGDGQFNTPLGIALDAEANLLVADSGNNRIKKCAPDGRFLGAWAVDGAPRAVTVGPGGKVYVLAGRRILRFSPEGALEATLAAEAGFEDPRGLAVDGAGFLYVADAARSSVTKLDENGAVISTWGSPGSGPGQLAAPSGVAVDAQGRVVVVERDNNRLQVFILGAGPGEGAGP